MKVVQSVPLNAEIDKIFVPPNKKSKQLKTWIAANEYDVTVTPPVEPPVEPPPVNPPTDLIEIDGGTSYYGQFTYPLSDDPSYFPIGVWYEAVLDQGNIDLDKDCGLNLYIYLTDDSRLDLIEAAGMKALLPLHWKDRADVQTNPAHAGWVVADEPDMKQANAEGAAIARADLEQRLASLPPDGRARYINFGKGVNVWNAYDDQQQFINNYSHLQSVDIYWFTDNDIDGQWQGGEFFGVHRDLTPAEHYRAANYGYIVDHTRELDTVDGKIKPQWNFVEVGQPFTDPDWPAIKPEEIKPAVWHSIIAGARGIAYFNHSFSGPNISHHCLREPAYAEQRAVVKAVNAQIKELAPVLNSPTAPNYCTTTPDVRVMSKYLDGKYTLFAGAKESVGSTATFTLAGVTSGTATVYGESRTIPIVGGKFSDAFADGNAIHIYHIG
jgi:hypothetical protein